MNDRIYSFSDFDRAFGRPENEKLIVCGTQRQRSWVADKVFDALSRNLNYDRLVFANQKQSYDFRVFDRRTQYSFTLEILSAEFEFNFQNKIRGNRYDEIIAEYSLGYSTLKSNGLLDEVQRSVLHQDVMEGSLLFRILGNEKFRQLPYNDGVSWVRDFDFPASLYRIGMEDYFKDPKKPTREEFLLALLMEDVNGGTEKEKKAILDAQIYVESESNKAHQG